MVTVFILTIVRKPQGHPDLHRVPAAVRYSRQRHPGERAVSVVGRAVPAVGMGCHCPLCRPGCLHAALVQPAWPAPRVQPGQRLPAGLRWPRLAGGAPLELPAHPQVDAAGFLLAAVQVGGVLHAAMQAQRFADLRHHAAFQLH